MATIRGTNAMASALGSGATGVYLDARPTIGYLSADDVARAVNLSRANGAELYVAVDGLLLPGDIYLAERFLTMCAASGVHGVSLTDLGLMKVVRERIPSLRIHVGQKANVHDAHTLRTFAELGASRVALAPQLTLAEVEVLAAVALEAGVEVEVLAHGPLCVSYSGLCVMSSLTGQGSDCRGECAALCRNEYTLVDLKSKEIETPAGSFLLSSKDFYALPALDRLIAGGVASVRVAGRDAPRAQTSATIAVVREALDAAVKGPIGSDALVEFERRIADAYNRGLTAGALGGDQGIGSMSLTRPDNRGVAIGRIVASANDRADIAFERPVRDGDVIEVRTRRGRFTQVLSNVPDGATTGKETISVRLKSYAQPGDRVLRLRSRDLEIAAADAALRAYQVRRPVDFTSALHIGSPFFVTVSDATGVSGTAFGGEVESARTRPVTAEEIAEHIDRLGNTPYLAGEIVVDIDENVGISFSEVHRVRTAALEQYALAVAQRDSAALPGSDDAADSDLDDAANDDASDDTRAPMPAAADPDRSLNVVASVDAFGGGKAAINAGCSTALVPAANLLESEPSPGIWAILPPVCHDHEFDELLGVAERFGGAVASTVGQIKTCAERNIPVAAHWSLGAGNAEAVAELAAHGAEFVWLSPELSGYQIAEITKVATIPVGIAVTGIVEVLTSDRCLLAVASECNGACAKCALRKEPHALLDALGYYFPLRVDDRGRSHLYNSVPLDMTDLLPELLTNGVAAVRLDLETALTSSVSSEVARVRRCVIDAYSGSELPEPADYTTRGRYFRSID